MGNVAFFQGVKAPSTIFFPLAQKFLSLKLVGWFQAEGLHALAVNAENVQENFLRCHYVCLGSIHQREA